MSEMVERVARALVESFRGTDYYDEIRNPQDMARAAIEAMGKPTEAMRQALRDLGNQADHPYWWENSVVHDPDFIRGADCDAWSILINAALAEGTEAATTPASSTSRPL